MNSKDFYGYTVCENGDIYGSHGKLVVRKHNGRYEIFLKTDKGRKCFILSRLLYWLFAEDFDYDDKNKCVIAKDGNFCNIKLDNLILVDRKDLIHGDKHIHQAKITDEQANEIRNLYKGKVGVNQFDKKGYSLNDIAKMYGIKKATVKAIVDGRCRNEKTYILK